MLLNDEKKEQLTAALQALDMGKIAESAMDIGTLSRQMVVPGKELDPLNVALKRFLHDERFIQLVLSLAQTSNASPQQVSFIFTFGLFLGLINRGVLANAN